jgi:hypothetical protein
MGPTKSVGDRSHSMLGGSVDSYILIGPLKLVFGAFLDLVKLGILGTYLVWFVNVDTPHLPLILLDLGPFF